MWEAVDLIIVFILTLLAGAWSTAAGVLMGVDPVAVYIAAVAGSLTFTSIVLFAAGPWRDRMFERYFPDAEDRISASGIGGVIERWGEPGLALSSIVIGPSLTLAAVLLLGVDRRRFFVWYGALTVVGFAVAVAFWVWVSP